MLSGCRLCRLTILLVVRDTNLRREPLLSTSSKPRCFISVCNSHHEKSAGFDRSLAISFSFLLILYSGLSGLQLDSSCYCRIVWRTGPHALSYTMRGSLRQEDEPSGRQGGHCRRGARSPCMRSLPCATADREDAEPEMPDPGPGTAFPPLPVLYFSSPLRELGDIERMWPGIRLTRGDLSEARHNYEEDRKYVHRIDHRGNGDR